MAEPFTDHLLADAARCLIVGVAFLLIAMALRLVWLRRRETDPDHRRLHVHPAMVLSYCGALILLIDGRVQSLGAPPTVWFWLALGVVVVGVVGLWQRVELTSVPPWRRR